MSNPDPALVAQIRAKAEAVHAHHEAGHAVAAVARGGYLVEIFLGRADYEEWTEVGMAADLPGHTRHKTSPSNAPFVTYAGPWSSAMWTVENDPEVDDFESALEDAWAEAFDGDGAKYDAVVEKLQNVAEEVGLFPIIAAWESDWRDDLELLWPAVREVAALLLDGQTVVHAQVLEAVRRTAYEL